MNDIIVPRSTKAFFFNLEKKKKNKSMSYCKSLSNTSPLPLLISYSVFSVNHVIYKLQFSNHEYVYIHIKTRRNCTSFHIVYINMNNMSGFVTN